RVDEDPWIGRTLLLRQIHGDQPLRNSDLNGGKADPRRLVHGFEHVVGELAHLHRHLFDGLRDEAELLVGQDDDFAKSHGGHVIWRNVSVNQTDMAVRRRLDLPFTEKVNRSLAGKINGSLTMIFKGVLPVWPACSLFVRMHLRIGYKQAMSEI